MALGSQEPFREVGPDGTRFASKVGQSTPCLKPPRNDRVEVSGSFGGEGSLEHPGPEERVQGGGPVMVSYPTSKTV